MVIHLNDKDSIETVILDNCIRHQQNLLKRFLISNHFKSYKFDFFKAIKYLKSLKKGIMKSILIYKMGLLTIWEKKSIYMWASIGLSPFDPPRVRTK